MLQVDPLIAPWEAGRWWVFQLCVVDVWVRCVPAEFHISLLAANADSEITVCRLSIPVLSCIVTLMKLDLVAQWKAVVVICLLTECILAPPVNIVKYIWSFVLPFSQSISFHQMWCYLCVWMSEYCYGSFWILVGGCVLKVNRFLPWLLKLKSGFPVLCAG
jgi:hypothetical protein